LLVRRAEKKGKPGFFKPGFFFEIKKNDSGIWIRKISLNVPDAWLD
jgi:hypothetical protein